MIRIINESYKDYYGIYYVRNNNWYDPYVISWENGTLSLHGANNSHILTVYEDGSLSCGSGFNYCNLILHNKLQEVGVEGYSSNRYHCFNSVDEAFRYISEALKEGEYYPNQTDEDKELTMIKIIDEYYNTDKN